MMDKQSKKYGEGYKLSKNSKNPNNQDVELFEGMPIISMKTDAKIGIVNNEMFSIKSIYGRKIEITDGSKTIEIDIDKFQYLFYVAYAIKINKSQVAHLTLNTVSMNGKSC